MLQARMLYTYKLPNGVLRLSDKAEYYADAADAYHNLAKVSSCPVDFLCTSAFLLYLSRTQPGWPNKE